MKKLLFGAITLSAFSTSLLLVQISCQKEAIATPASAGLQQQGKIIFAEGGGVIASLTEIWIANYDGTNATKIPVPTLPSGFEFKALKISPDGQTIFIAGYDNMGNISQVYSMTTTGSNLKKIINYDGYTASASIIADMQAY